MIAKIDSVTTPVHLVWFSFLSLLLCGAIFGFFYAWVCSTLWGLDAADPDVAIAAMQAMNASVRNAVFFPAFFGTPVILILTAILSYFSQRRVAALAFATSAVVYVVGAFLTTMTVNVPMNEALAAITIPENLEEARQIWQRFSNRWQVWNLIRTIASGISLMLTGYALFHLSTERAP